MDNYNQSRIRSDTCQGQDSSITRFENGPFYQTPFQNGDFEHVWPPKIRKKNTNRLIFTMDIACWRSCSVTLVSDMNQSPDGKRAKGRRPKSSTISTKPWISGCDTSFSPMCSGTSTSNFQSSSVISAADSLPSWTAESSELFENGTVSKEFKLSGSGLNPEGWGSTARLRELVTLALQEWARLLSALEWNIATLKVFWKCRPRKHTVVDEHLWLVDDRCKRWDAYTLRGRNVLQIASLEYNRMGPKPFEQLLDA